MGTAAWVNYKIEFNKKTGQPTKLKSCIRNLCLTSPLDQTRVLWNPTGILTVGLDERDGTIAALWFKLALSAATWGWNCAIYFRPYVDISAG